MCTVEIIKAKVHEWAKSANQPIRVYLFGSRAKGTHKPDSDIDIAIEPLIPFKEDWLWETWWGQGNRENWGKELENILGGWVDFQRYREGHFPCLSKYLKDCSIILYP